MHAGEQLGEAAVEEGKSEKGVALDYFGIGHAQDEGGEGKASQPERPRISCCCHMAHFCLDIVAAHKSPPLGFEFCEFFSYPSLVPEIAERSSAADVSSIMERDSMLCEVALETAGQEV